MAVAEGLSSIGWLVGALWRAPEKDRLLTPWVKAVKWLTVASSGGKVSYTWRGTNLFRIKSSSWEWSLFAAYQSMHNCNVGLLAAPCGQMRNDIYYSCGPCSSTCSGCSLLSCHRGQHRAQHATENLVVTQSTQMCDLLFMESGNVPTSDKKAFLLEASGVLQTQRMRQSQTGRVSHRLLINGCLQTHSWPLEIN